MDIRDLTVDERIEQIQKGMTNIKPNEEQINRIEIIRTLYKSLVRALLENSKQSREQSLAITKLEESLMFATKNIVLEE